MLNETIQYAAFTPYRMGGRGGKDSHVYGLRVFTSSENSRHLYNYRVGARV